MSQSGPQATEIAQADLLVVRGASCTDDLQSLGLAFAERYQRARRVMLISDDGRGRYGKGFETLVEGQRIDFVDVDSRLDCLLRAVERISSEYQRRHPEHAHLAHCHVGRWLMFAHVDDGDVPRSVLEWSRDGRNDLVERSVDVFVSSGFEDLFADRGISSGSERGYGTPDDHLPSGSVPVEDGGRLEHGSDRA